MRAVLPCLMRTHMRSLRSFRSRRSHKPPLPTHAPMPPLLALAHTDAPAHRWFGVAERLLRPQEVGEVGVGEGSDEALVLLLGRNERLY